MKNSGLKEYAQDKWLLLEAFDPIWKLKIWDLVLCYAKNNR